MRVGRVYLCQPCYQSGLASSHRAFMTGALLKDDQVNGRLDLSQNGGSLLANGFNNHWCTALNFQAQGRDVTHFAMLHDDVVPDDGWLRILLDDMEESDADLVSAAIPIKDHRGLLSTAIDGDDPFRVLRRITLSEAAKLPGVFTAADCGYPDRKLLVNTGCWICRMDRPWRWYPHFEINDRIVYSLTKALTPDDELYQEYYTKQTGVEWFATSLHGKLPIIMKLPQEFAADLAVEGRLPKGDWIAEVDPEDWNFSRQIQNRGAKVVCSRRVPLVHVGLMPWPNNRSWGEMARDENILQGTDVAPIKSGDPIIVANQINPQVQYTVSVQYPDVAGWRSDKEGEWLRTMTQGMQVLEIGAYKGRSTIWMATNAVSVDVVDTFDGRTTPNPHDTYGEFKANMQRYGLADKIRTHVGESCEIPQHFKEQGIKHHSFDVIVIDGAHDFEGVSADFNRCEPFLVPGGVMIFDDFHTTDPRHFGVGAVVSALLSTGKYEDIGHCGAMIAIRQVPNATNGQVHEPVSINTTTTLLNIAYDNGVNKAVMWDGKAVHPASPEGKEAIIITHDGDPSYVPDINLELIRKESHE